LNDLSVALGKEKPKIADLGGLRRSREMHRCDRLGWVNGRAIRYDGWQLAENLVMAEYQRIEYRIGPDGKVVETVLGATGDRCVSTTAGIEQALGEVETREYLPEYDEVADVAVVVESGQQS
jgi:Protein of unknown function (DUF2997)